MAILHDKMKYGEGACFDSKTNDRINHRYLILVGVAASKFGDENVIIFLSLCALTAAGYLDQQ